MAISILQKIKLMSAAPADYSLQAPLPDNIMIEVTNHCQLRCQMCAHQAMKRPSGFMKFDLFKKIINQVVDLKINHLGLYTTGEPFLHPQIFDFITFAKSQGIEYVYITTNGQAISPDMVDKIFMSKLDSIKFSIDSASKAHYEELKPGANWEKLLGTITHIKNRRDQLNSHLRIFASYLITPSSLKYLLEYQKIFGNLIDETNFSIIATQGSRYPTKNILSGLKKILPELKLSASLHPCPLLWNRFIVTYEGYLTICCFDFDNQYLYGDLNQSSLRECWNNLQMLDYRRLHVARNFSQLPHCLNCDHTRCANYSNESINKFVRRQLLNNINPL